MTERTAALSGESTDNTVELRGRISSAPVERELPSGTVITTFRLSIPRAKTPMTAASSQSVDWVDCAAWSAKCRRAVNGWQSGDEVHVSGALRRRFFRAGEASTTRLEVEVLTAKRAKVREPPVS